MTPVHGWRVGECAISIDTLLLLNVFVTNAKILLGAENRRNCHHASLPAR
jgi:hypothetical protein